MTNLHEVALAEQAALMTAVMEKSSKVAEISAGIPGWLFGNGTTKGAFQCADPKLAGSAKYVPAPWLDVVDIEAAASTTQLSVIVGSHSTDKAGNRRAKSERICCIRPTGITFQDHLTDYIRGIQSPLTQALVSSVGKAPDSNGFDLEGAALMPMPSAPPKLILGFRTPLVGADAAPYIVVHNTDALGTIKRLEMTIGTFDLGRRGVRDMLFAGGDLYVLAGPGAKLTTGGGSKFQVHRFSSHTFSLIGVRNLPDGPHWECLQPSLTQGKLVVISDANSGAQAEEISASI